MIQECPQLYKMGWNRVNKGITGMPSFQEPLEI